MEIRVLRYFLAVAQEGNISKAAELLHITQPTLSRQMMNLEEELGVILFQRGKQQILLTENGILFQQRAKEIVLLADKTQREFVTQKNKVSGVISIGCVESTAMKFLPELLEEFSRKYPMVQYDLYSGYGDDIKEKIDRGLLDIGILIEPVEISKYEYMHLPQSDRWGLFMKKDMPLAGKPSIRIQDMVGLPLIFPKRELLQTEVAKWVDDFDRLHIVATYNLLHSAVFMVERGMGYALCLDGASDTGVSADTCFVAFEPERRTRNLLIWKRNRGFNPATALFVEFVKHRVGYKK